MIETVRRNVIEKLKSAVSLIRKKDYYSLKLLSNETVHNASIFQDDDSVSFAVIIYALSKIMEHGRLRSEKVIYKLEHMISAADKNDEKSYRKYSQELMQLISKVDSKAGMYISNVVEQAQLKKGCRLCFHGISTQRVSQLTGVSQWELMPMLGKTEIAELSSETVRLEDRIRLSRKIFSIK